MTACSVTSLKQTPTYFREWLAATKDPRPLLLVEDCAADRDMIIRGSEEYNIDWTIAGNYQDSIKALETGKEFKMVILDLQLGSSPGGYELFCQIKDRWPWIPVLVLSGHMSEHDQDRLYQIGFFIYLKKPRSFDARFFGELYFAFDIKKKPEKIAEKEKKEAYNI